MATKQQPLKRRLGFSLYAILMYLERVHGIKTEFLKADMIDSKALEQIYELGSGRFPVGDSHILIVENDNIVNVIKQQKNKTKEERKEYRGKVQPQRPLRKGKRVRRRKRSRRN